MRKTSAIAIFWGSFLSFGVQPLAGRTLLPYFGGSGAVWVTCLCAFQVLLLAGYWYAFIPAAAKRRRVAVHLLMVVLAAVTLALFGLYGEVVLHVLKGQSPLGGVLAGVMVSVGGAFGEQHGRAGVERRWTRRIPSVCGGKCREFHRTAGVSIARGAVRAASMAVDWFCDRNIVLCSLAVACVVAECAVKRVIG